jgi:hypothetical protein
MSIRVLLAGAVILSASCNKTEGGDGFGGALGPAAGSAKTQGSGGGFSAELASDLGAGSAAKPAPDKPGEPAAAGSRGSGVPVAAADGKAGAGSDSAAAGSDAKSAAAADGKAGGSKAARAPAAADRPDTGASDKADPAPARSASHGPVKVPGEVAAIKLSLLPNWDRDIDAPGTIQYVVRIKGTQSTKTFTFHYGYDDPKAPADHDQYKKYLQDTHAFTGDVRDRQRGAAWFLEGNDAQGLPAFRYVVLYGGKRLICYGSLYKDADSNRLGDDRDQTLIQAKQICETLAL